MADCSPRHAIIQPLRLAKDTKVIAELREPKELQRHFWSCREKFGNFWRQIPYTKKEPRKTSKLNQTTTHPFIHHQHNNFLLLPRVASPTTTTTITCDTTQNISSKHRKNHNTTKVIKNLQKSLKINNNNKKQPWKQQRVNSRVNSVSRPTP